MPYLTGKHVPRRTFLQGMGAAVALPFLDAMVPAGMGAAAKTAAAEGNGPTRLVCIEEVHGQAGTTAIGREQVPVRAGDDGPGLQADPRQPVQRGRPLPRLHDDDQQHRRPDGRGVRGAGNRRRPLPLERGVPDAVASEADAGRRHLGRHVARPDVREEVRAVDADAVDAVLHREPRPGRRLHLQLLVRLHGLDQLGVAERAAADDSRPARRVRHAVRRRRHAGSARRAARRRAAGSSTGSTAR